MKIKTYVIGKDGCNEYIFCMACSSKSFNKNDINELYCGNCHKYHEFVVEDKKQDRDEYMRHVRARALEYIGRGEGGNALASVLQDMSSEGYSISNPTLNLGLSKALTGNLDGLKQWIEELK